MGAFILQQPRFLFFDLKVHFVPHKDDGQLDGDRAKEITHGQRHADKVPRFQDKSYFCSNRSNHTLSRSQRQLVFAQNLLFTAFFPFESGIVVEIFTKYYYFEAILYKPSSQGM